MNLLSHTYPFSKTTITNLASLGSSGPSLAQIQAEELAKQQQKQVFYEQQRMLNVGFFFGILTHYQRTEAYRR